MEELVIQKHNFEAAKNKIQKYAETAPKGVSIPSVKTDGGLFGWGDHKVTGAELNERMVAVQTALISLNSASKAIISEFKEVYNAFEALDTDYISGIVISVNAAKKASDEAKKASDDISRTIEALKKTVGKLSNFENEVRNEIASLKAKVCQTNNNQLVKLEQTLSAVNKFKNTLVGLQHLTDIDALWKQVQTQHSIIVEHKKSLGDFTRVTQDLNKEVATLLKYKAKLEGYAHLNDIDALWSDSQKGQEEIVNTKKNFNDFLKKNDTALSSISSNLAALNGYTDKLKSFSHLDEVDIIWDDLQTQKARLDEFKQVYETYVSNMASSFQSLSETEAELSRITSDHTGRIKKLESDTVSTNERITNENAQLSHRIRVNHIISASSVILLIALFILNILNVL